MPAEHPIREYGDPIQTNTGSVSRRTQMAVPTEIAGKIFAGFEQEHRPLQPDVIVSSPFTPFHAGEAHFVNTTTGIVELPDTDAADVGFIGNTVLGACPHGGCKDGCQLKNEGASFKKLRDANCAVGNTEKAFSEVGQRSEGRFMLLPTKDDVLVISNETRGSAITIADEAGKQQTAFFRLPPARAIVFGEKWVKEQGISSITAGINGADANFGLMSVTLPDENFVVAFCLIRDNLGDRPENLQVLRKSINAIFDEKRIPENKRAELLATLPVRIDIGAAATLENFGHSIQLPKIGTPYATGLANHLAATTGMTEEDFTRRAGQTERFIALAKQLANPDLSDDQRSQLEAQLPDRTSIIASGRVMDWQYPGALTNGFVYGEAEAQLGLEAREPDTCPGYGQTCHIDYRGITQYSATRQLTAMGIAPTNIDWYDELAIDPSDTRNYAESNRAVQLAWNSVGETAKPSPYRTFNGATVRFPTE